MIEWGMPIEGREFKALEVFNASMQWWEDQKSSGNIAAYQAYGTLTGNYGARSGFFIVEGSLDQIDKLRHSEDYRKLLNRVVTIVHNVRTDLLETGKEMQTRMERYGKDVKDVIG
jgi:hypothetical protein